MAEKSNGPVPEIPSQLGRPSGQVHLQQASARADVVARPLDAGDRRPWLRLWNAYNAFYGRSGKTALSRHVTDHTWRRCIGRSGGLEALVATIDGQVCGIAHALFHEATISLRPYCYLSDIYTDQAFRGRGVGTALIEEVYRLARRRGAARVYWQTQASNAGARHLYDMLAENSGFIVYRKVF